VVDEGSMEVGGKSEEGVVKQPGASCFKMTGRSWPREQERRSGDDELKQKEREKQTKGWVRDKGCGRKSRNNNLTSQESTNDIKSRLLGLSFVIDWSREGSEMER
jgi:hypothetical protein